MSIVRILILSIVLFSVTSSVFAEEGVAYDLNLEDLLNTPVSSTSKKAHTQVSLASKKSQSLTTTAAATYVISNEDIKRSGATSLPDALRMAPGLDVARIDSNKWAVSARGFNGRFANKLLVLIDGRSIYNPSFSGVYWENQDVVLEDVDRIEIIRGPGAALWGANAVNGVINVITKHSADTQNIQLTAGGGNQEQGFGSLSYGAELGQDTTARAYVKGFNRGDYNHLDGSNAHDKWNQVQGGFRVDSMWTVNDAVTILGNIFESNTHQSTNLDNLNPPEYTEIIHEKMYASGANILGRLQHTLSATSDFTVQASYNLYKRNEIIDHQIRHTYDIDFQHHFSWKDWHDIIWGLNYRFMDVSNIGTRPEVFEFTRLKRNDQYFSAFAQDELSLIDDSLWLTLGLKLEHNDYSGFEFQPTARLMWSPIREHYLWTAISRAVRTPATIDENLRFASVVAPPKSATNPTPFPVQVVITGNSDFKAEELLAYEIGYRTNSFKSVSLDFTAFYNDYESLRGFSEIDLTFNGSALQKPLLFGNKGYGNSVGFETSTVWQMLHNWRWELNYSFLKTHFYESGLYQEMTPPQHKISLRSSLDPLPSVNVDFWLRYIGQSTVQYSNSLTVNGNPNGNFPISGYLTLDARVAWKVNNAIELSLVGQNLLDNRHLEYLQETFTTPTEIDRSVYGKIVWRY